MTDYIKKYIKTIRLNSFHPLCETDIGQNAVNKFGYPPFIDASCRREPDFENPFPSITALCRQEKFAPQLYPNDIVVYMTVKGKWLTHFDHYRIIAILEVIERKDTHLQAKSWYTNKGLTIPSKCMIHDNPPHSFNETGGRYEKQKDISNFLTYPPDKQKIIGDRIVSHWDNEYLAKSKKWSCFVISKPIFMNLTDPPILTDQDILNIFKKKINTRTPKKLTVHEFTQIAKFADVNFIRPN
ncbi:MAG: hypothetical protein E6H07_09530 [Bacteroidetes bacterium]|nr:MAG: hypothetical protein E6H07_09530 [Bacteroidota bacterium]